MAFLFAQSAANSLLLNALRARFALNIRRVRVMLLQVPAE
jgi:hypothetical protein